MDQLLEIKVESAKRTNDYVGANASLFRDVAIRVFKRNVSGVVGSGDADLFTRLDSQSDAGCFRCSFAIGEDCQKKEDGSEDFHFKTSGFGCGVCLGDACRNQRQNGNGKRLVVSCKYFVSTSSLCCLSRYF